MANSQTRVAVVGGGIAGLTAAHELADRGFSVTVFEARKGEPGEPHTALGGKARSWLGGPSQEAPSLPAEHGFRFFPGFYKHVIDTMRLIPSADGRSVADHLISLPVAVLALANGQRLQVPLPTAADVPTARDRLRAALSFRRAMPGPWECACALGSLARLATSCEPRRKRQLEHQSWLEYVNPRSGARRSPTFHTLFAVGLTRAFVATRAEEMSARTGGTILLQLLYDMFNLSDRDPADRVLDGPTSDVWIEPWYRLLVSKGVSFKLDRTLQRIYLDGCGRVEQLGFRPQDEVRPYLSEPPFLERNFDCCVLALPCERLKQLLALNLCVAQRAHRLTRVFNLKTAWMNGLVFGCLDDLGLPKGHIMCLDSQWALTLIDQRQVWSKDYRDRFLYKSLLSVDISDWETPGFGGVSASWTQPPRKQIAEETWTQLRKHLPELPPEPCDDHLLDPGIKHTHSEYYVTTRTMGRGHWGSPDHDENPDGANTLTSIPEHESSSKPDDPDRDPGGVLGIEAVERTNAEPLLINTPGSWRNRPKVSVKGISNLFLASDYVRTNTDFASMEAANEAAKRAVNAILARYGRIAHEPCRVYDLEDPQVSWFKAPQTIARRADKILFRVGLRAPFRLPILAWILLGITAQLRGRGAHPRPETPLSSGGGSA